MTRMAEKLSLLLKFAQRYWLWVVRAVIILLVLNQFVSPGVRVILDPPQTVETQKPHVCVHTRLIDEVPEWLIQKSLQAVREMGADTIVEFFPWAYVEYQEGQYRWGQTDLIINHARNQGLRIIARIGLVPEWARPKPDKQFTTFNYIDDEAFAAFADYVAVFAERYAGVVDDIIIWNEPNLAFEWGYRQTTPVDYVRLLREVYPLAHAANPNINIIAGALAPTIEPEGSPHGLNDILYLRGIYEAGGADYFDSLAIHTYGFTFPPETPPDFDEINFRRAELLRDIMVEYGNADTPVYITESGWNDHPRWTKGVRPSQRVAYTIGGLQWAEKEWEWAEKVCIWALRYPRPTYSYPDNYTLITPDFQIKPIYYALQAYARGWEGVELSWLPAPNE
jgi:polysaccharide biosynthesis protein PslG